MKSLQLSIRAMPTVVNHQFMRTGILADVMSRGQCSQDKASTGLRGRNGQRSPGELDLVPDLGMRQHIIGSPLYCLTVFQVGSPLTAMESPSQSFTLALSGPSTDPAVLACDWTRLLVRLNLFQSAFSFPSLPFCPLLVLLCRPNHSLLLSDTIKIPSALSR